MSIFTVSVWVEIEAEDLDDAYDQAGEIAASINGNVLDVEEQEEGYD